MPMTLVELASVDYNKWRLLWLDYLGRYRDELPEALHLETYARLCGHKQGLHGLCVADGDAIAFAHFYFHPSTFSASQACMLEDLYVSPSARGQGVAKMLIAAVAQRAQAMGAYKLHWKTRASNTAAIALYEQVATRVDEWSYRVDLSP